MAVRDDAEQDRRLLLRSRRERPAVPRGSGRVGSTRRHPAGPRRDDVGRAARAGRATVRGAVPPAGDRRPGGRVLGQPGRPSGDPATARQDGRKHGRTGTRLRGAGDRPRPGPATYGDRASAPGGAGPADPSFGRGARRGPHPVTGAAVHQPSLSRAVGAVGGGASVREVLEPATRARGPAAIPDRLPDRHAGGRRAVAGARPARVREVRVQPSARRAAAGHGLPGRGCAVA